MARDYAKVLNALETGFLAIGRGEKSAHDFESETGNKVISGGLDQFLSAKPELPESAIVAVGIEALSETTQLLLKYGVKKILLEKPGVGYPEEINELVQLTQEKDAQVLLAYNRRFYTSIIKAKEIIEQDGGVTSFNFEFTEWSHVIKDLKKTEAEHHNWFLGNSTHIVDSAFYLCGKPKEISTYVSGEGNLNWHPKSSNFSGAGITETGALFAYHANWEAPGRWAIEVLTKKHRLIFKPIEKLQIQEIGSIAVNEVNSIDYSLDEQYKPGLYLQTKAFLEGDCGEFCNVFEQQKAMECYRGMSNY
ncbi:MAG: myo-inositol 2-dehydrogenase [Flavobacteriales bacterium]|nr:MAG: myo-inositol 2-dehydrogenase [Flavobacteriales bacterium]